MWILSATQQQLGSGATKYGWEIQLPSGVILATMSRERAEARVVTKKGDDVDLWRRRWWRGDDGVNDGFEGDDGLPKTSY